MHRFIPVQRTTADAPPALAAAIARAGLGPAFHYAGNALLAASPTRVAMIGTRHPSDEARGCIEALAGRLAAQATIVSGAAWGTDMAAHRGALGAGGATIAAVPCALPLGGMDRWGDLIADLRDPDLLLLVSPFAIDQPYTRATPVIRNRLIASLAQAVVVGEANSNSGTFHCVRFAREMGLPLFLLRDPSIPRDPDLEDLHAQLLRQGAVEFCLDDCWGEDLPRAIVAAAQRHSREQHEAERRQLSLFGEDSP